MTTKRILVVDDEAGLRMTLAAGLELEGFTVHEAGSGEEALTMLEGSAYDLILSDIRMPGMSGGDLFRRVKERSPDLPVVLMTAYAAEHVVREATGEGVYAVLTKPFDIGAVSSTLRRAVKRPWVLIIDDAEPFAHSMVSALFQAGVRAQAVASGKDALEIVGKSDGEIDVCVVDLVMSGLNGAEVVEQLKAVDPALVFIVVSGHDVPELVAEALRKGARRFVRKPVHPVELVRLITKARGESLQPAGR
ncbi:MAG TPA: response regulator [Polyangiaceae bacterium]|nr:response regulator [Polyangiaceae bacterium]